MADDAEQNEQVQPNAAKDSEALLKQVEEVQFGTARVTTVSPAESVYAEGGFVGTDPIYQTPQGGSREALAAEGGVEEKLEAAHKASVENVEGSEPPAAVKKNYEGVSAGVSGTEQPQVVVVNQPTTPDATPSEQTGETQGDGSADGSSQDNSQGKGLLD